MLKNLLMFISFNLALYLFCSRCHPAYDTPGVRRTLPSPLP